MSSATAASPGYAVSLGRLGDERLALRVADGDAPAFAVIYERYHQQLFRYCRSILREEGDAHDALQSTFERAFAALQRSQRSAPLRPWLFRIAHNEAITLIRRRGADEPSETLDIGLAPSAEHAASERARLAVILDDLADLPERPRGALVMRELGDLSHEEIALALEISVGAAKQAIFEARRALLECVEGRAMACEEIQRKISDGDGRALRGRRVRAHMRDCAACTAFAVAIPERQTELRALTPLLAPAAAAAIFARAAGSVHGGAGLGVSAGGSVGAGGLGSGGLGSGGLGGGAALGKIGMAGAALSSKLAVVAAVVATAAAGAGGVVAVAHLTASHGAATNRVRSSTTRSGSTTAGSTSGSTTVRTATSHAARPAIAARTKSRSHAARSSSHHSASSHSAAAAHAHPAVPSSQAAVHASGTRGNSAVAHSRGHASAPAKSHGRSQHGSTGASHGNRHVAPIRVPPTNAGPKIAHKSAPPSVPSVSLSHKS